MRLKWPPVGLRRGRSGPEAARLLAACRPAPADRSAIPRGAGQRRLLPAHEGAVGRWPRVRVGTLQPGVWTFRDATEDSCESLCSHGQRGLPLRGRLGRTGPVVGRGGHCVQWPADGVGPPGRVVGRTSRCGRWCPNGRIRPVLKHGPRSATCVRVFGWQTLRRNESEGRCSGLLWREPPARGRTVDRSRATLWRDLSESVPVATRKMVNYA